MGSYAPSEQGVLCFIRVRHSQMRRRSGNGMRSRTDFTRDPAHQRAYLEYLEGFHGAGEPSIRSTVTKWRSSTARRPSGEQDLLPTVHGAKAGLFAESGVVGVVVPSAFHANEGSYRRFDNSIQQHVPGMLLFFREPSKTVQIHSQFQVCFGGRGNGGHHQWSSLVLSICTTMSGSSITMMGDSHCDTRLILYVAQARRYT